MQWFKAPSPFDSPYNDLKFFKKLSLSKGFKLISNFHLNLLMKVLQKFENHLWYLSERLVVLSLFSDKVSNEDKNKMAKKMIKVFTKFQKN